MLEQFSTNRFVQRQVDDSRTAFKTQTICQGTSSQCLTLVEDERVGGKKRHKLRREEIHVDVREAEYAV